MEQESERTAGLTGIMAVESERLSTRQVQEHVDKCCVDGCVMQ